MPGCRTLTEQWGKLRPARGPRPKVTQSGDRAAQNTLHPVFYTSTHPSKNNTNEKNNRRICWIHPRCRGLQPKAFHAGVFILPHFTEATLLLLFVGLFLC